MRLTSIASPEASFSQILQSIVADVQELVRSELRLAKAEFRQDMSAFKSVAVIIAVGSLMAVFALSYAFYSAMSALALVLPSWASALLLAFALGAAAGVTLRAGLHRLKQVDITPNRTIEGIKEATQ